MSPQPSPRHRRQHAHAQVFLSTYPLGTHKASDVKAAYEASASEYGVTPLGRGTFYSEADLVLGLRWRKGGADVYRVARDLDEPSVPMIGWSTPPVPQKATDVLEGFLPGVYVPDPASRMEAPVLFAAFEAYAAEHRLIELRRWSNQRFYRALEERGYMRKRSTGGKFVVLGVRKAG
ncbi:hypothetical protein [Frigoribacterium sp. MCBA15_019]|uniref:hypothetical protein n=1 Tax=Frigoribacterium sp. MCBA15_019 TaxID=1898745 RepID=UPI00091C3286|nr:hypothetical protein [Frigoribacterium sp. MCBA15_019]OII27539.1 hypothetical protein BIV04_03110 [Frigoribacterium sp. MCBA15_019]